MHVEMFDCTFERRVTGVVETLLALLLSAASCGAPPLPVTFDLSVTPGEVELERGGEVAAGGVDQPLWWIHGCGGDRGS